MKASDAFREDAPLPQSVVDTLAYLDAKDRRIAELEKALGFYSDGFAYITPGGWKAIWEDAGATARAALKPTEGPSHD